MNLVARKDNKNLAGLDNIEVDAKTSIKELLEFISNIEHTNSEFYNNNRNQLLQVHNNLTDIKDTLRQHLHDNVKKESEVAEHCINYAFNDSSNFKKCNHAHTNCSYCNKLFSSIDIVGKIVKELNNIEGLYFSPRRCARYRRCWVREGPGWVRPRARGAWWRAGWWCSTGALYTVDTADNKNNADTADTAVTANTANTADNT